MNQKVVLLWGTLMFLKTKHTFSIIALCVAQTCFAAPDMEFKETLQDQKDEKIVYQLHDTSCGSASLAMLMKNFMNQNDTEKSVLEFTATTKDGQHFDSITFLDMQNYVKFRGFEGIAQFLSFQKMVELTKKRKIPFIIRIKTTKKGDIKTTDEAKYAYHFVVVRGVANNLVNIADPSEGNLQFTKDEFLERMEKDQQGNGEVFFIIPKNNSGYKLNKSFVKDPSYYEFDRPIPSFRRY